LGVPGGVGRASVCARLGCDFGVCAEVGAGCGGTEVSE
jgi:hypothetical protein